MGINPRNGILAGLLAAALSTAAATAVATAGTALPTAGTTMTSTAPGTTISAKPSAFPATGKGHGSEKVCGQYNALLAQDQAALDAAKGFSAQLAADMELSDSKDAATSAGCVVID